MARQKLECNRHLVGLADDRTTGAKISNLVTQRLRIRMLGKKTHTSVTVMQFAMPSVGMKVSVDEARDSGDSVTREERMVSATRMSILQRA